MMNHIFTCLLTFGIRTLGRCKMGSLPDPEEEVGVVSREWELQKPLKISSDSTIKNKQPYLKKGKGLE